MSCSQTLNGLARDCETSKGGIIEAYIANFDDVESVTVSEDMITAITMADSAKFKKYVFKRNTGNYASTLNVDPANGVNFVSTDIVFQFTKMETAKRVEIAALSVGELAVIVKDANGKYWYFGKDEAVSASAGSGQTGTARTDGNMYSITLQDNSETWPYEIQVKTGADGSGVDLSTIVE